MDKDVGGAVERGAGGRGEDDRAAVEALHERAVRVGGAAAAELGAHGRERRCEAARQPRTRERRGRPAAHVRERAAQCVGGHGRRLRRRVQRDRALHGNRHVQTGAVQSHPRHST